MVPLVVRNTAERRLGRTTIIDDKRIGAQVDPVSVGATIVGLVVENGALAGFDPGRDTEMTVILGCAIRGLQLDLVISVEIGRPIDQAANPAVGQAVPEQAPYWPVS